jgi:selenocysteine lyase/cysteine desulfurase
MAFDAQAIRGQFPILGRNVRLRDGRDVPLTYLDHGASTHAPQPVIAAVNDLMTSHYANIHRGNHTLSREATDLFDDVQTTIARFVGAPSDHVVVMGQNTTMALDLAAHVMADTPGATLTTLAEHHSNDLPHRARGDVLHAGIDDEGRVDLDDVAGQLAAHDVKLVTVTGASNVTGALPPIHDIARLAHEHGARILVDGAQLYAHAPIDMMAADDPGHIDFLAAAGHKAYAPYGSACLVAPRDMLDAAQPYLPGGGTVTWVTDDSAMWTASPDRHMGGTPNVAGAVAFGAATHWLSGIGMDAVRAHEEELIRYALARFSELELAHDGLELFGPRDVSVKGAVFSFLPGGLPHDAVSATFDAAYGIATRNGCFCAHPLLQRLLRLTDTRQWTEPLSRGESVALPGAVRAAVGIYNTRDDLSRFFHALDDVMAGRTPLETHNLPPHESAMLVS